MRGTPPAKPWMVFLWLAILSIIVGVSALWGGRDCQVPKSGPFHWLFKGHEFVATGNSREACRMVK